MTKFRLAWKALTGETRPDVPALLEEAAKAAVTVSPLAKRLIGDGMTDPREVAQAIADETCMPLRVVQVNLACAVELGALSLRAGRLS